MTTIHNLSSKQSSSTIHSIAYLGMSFTLHVPTDSGIVDVKVGSDTDNPTNTKDAPTNLSLPVSEFSVIPNAQSKELKAGVKELITSTFPQHVSEGVTHIPTTLHSLLPLQQEVIDNLVANNASQAIIDSTLAIFATHISTPQAFLRLPPKAKTKEELAVLPPVIQGVEQFKAIADVSLPVEEVEEEFDYDEDDEYDVPF